jgi:ABC-2 type transport system permease protein
MMLLLCGVNYPLNMLPDAAQSVAGFLPMTHGLQALRKLLEGDSYLGVRELLTREVGIGLFYAVVAYLVWHWQIERARRTGTTEFF